MTQPKKRVYELARELNMTNKALLEKISSLDLGLNSHMSALDESSEAKIRQFIHGGPTADLVEKRVRPTVIRRRKKVTQPEEDMPAPEEKPEIEQEIEEFEAEEAESDIAAEAVPADTAEVETQAADEDAVPEEAAATVAEEQAPAAKAPSKAEEKAKIVKPAPVAEKEPVEETAEEKEEKAVEVEEPPEPQPPDEVAAEPSEVEKETEEKTPEMQEAPAAVVTAKPKKKKKETAAKIIKLPERPPVAEPTPDLPPIERPADKVAEGPAPPKSDRADRPKKKGKKRGVEPVEPQQDKKFVKKKISFRKKEVVEGADLYDRVRSRKGRKGGKAKAVPAAQKTQITTAKAIKRRVRIDETIVLSDLAKRMGIKAGDMIAKLMTMGMMVTVNQTIDYDTAVLVAGEFDYEVEKATFEEEAILQTTQEDAT